MRVNTDLDFYECGNELETWSNTSVFKRKSLRHLQCVDLDTLPSSQRSLNGNYFSDLFRYINIGFIPCISETVEGEQCAEREEVEKFLKRKTLQYTLTESYLDIEDYQDLVKTFVNAEIYLDFNWNFLNKINVFMRPGDIVDSQSLKNSGSYLKLGKEEKFNSPYVPGKRLATIYVRLENFQEYSQKTSFIFVELLAEIGGLTELAFVLGLAFTEIFTGRLFVADMISRLYAVSKDSDSTPAAPQADRITPDESLDRVDQEGPPEKDQAQSNNSSFALQENEMEI